MSHGLGGIPFEMMIPHHKKKLNEVEFTYEKSILRQTTHLSLSFGFYLFGECGNSSYSVMISLTKQHTVTTRVSETAIRSFFNYTIAQTCKLAPNCSLKAVPNFATLRLSHKSYAFWSGADGNVTPLFPQPRRRVGPLISLLNNKYSELGE